MQEKSNKPFQQKLDALTELPDGFSFDAARSWNGIEEKLTSRHKKNKRALWFMAAASLITLLISMFYFNQPVKVNPVAVNPDLNIKEQPRTIESKSSPAVLYSAPKENKTVTAPIKKRTEDNTIIAHESNLPTKVQELIIQPTAALETKVELSSSETTTIANPVITAPVKQKIIHINELMQEYHLEQQRVAEAKRNQKPVEEEASPDKNPEPPKPWYKKSKQHLFIKNQ